MTETYEYTIPAETVVKRLFADDVLQLDQFTIEIDGATVCTIDYDTARAYWLGKTTLAAIIAGSAQDDKNEAPTGYNFSYDK